MTEVDADKVWALCRQTKSAGANLKKWPPTDKNSVWYKVGVELGVIEGAPPPPPPPPPPSAGPFGCAWNGNSLGNLEVGKYPGRAVSHMWRANHSGPFSSLRFYNKHNDTSGGYAKGDGGKIHVDICRDNGGVPGAVVGSGDLPNAKGSYWPEFSISGQSVEGDRYHNVFTNIHGDPVNNFTSVNDMYASPASNPRQPAVADSDLAVVWRFRTGDSWQLNDRHTPIFTVTWQDGHEQGQGYSDFRSSSGLKTLGSVTETLKPTATRSFTKAWARVKGQGTLTHQLAGKTAAISVNNSGWQFVPADLAVTLQARQDYPWTLTGNGSLQIYPYRKGSADGFLNPFPEGYGPSSSEDWPVYLT